MALKKSQTLSKSRREYTAHLSEPSVVPVTRNGKFAGVIISIGDEVSEQMAKRYAQRVKANPVAGINEILEIALKEEE